MKFNKFIKKLLFLLVAFILLLTFVSCDYVNFDALSDLLNGKTDIGAPKCSHTGGVATCKSKAECSKCKQPYGELDPDNHESDELNYTVNDSDSTKHDKKYACCAATESTMSHTWNEGEITTQPTESEEGTKTYTCTVCLHTKSESIPTTSHTHSGVKTEAKESNCLTEGNIEYWYCEGCGKYSLDAVFNNIILKEATVIQITDDHTGGVATCDDLAICSVCNEPYGDFAAHELEKKVYDSTSCANAVTVVSRCKNCTYSETYTLASKLEHIVSSWKVVSKNPTENPCEYVVKYVGSCIVCSETGITKTEKETLHSYSSSITTLAENCKSAGVKTYTCSSCNDSYTENYNDPNAHIWIDSGESVNGAQPMKCSVAGCSAAKSVVILLDNKIDKNNIGINELNIGNVSMSIDSYVLGALSDGEVVFGASVLTGNLRDDVTARLTEEQRNLLGDRDIYDFNLFGAEGAITEFNNGYITVSVPYALGAGEDPDRIVVWYVSEDGVAETISTVYSNGKITFKTNHFSTFAISSATAGQACLVNGHKYIDGDIVSPGCSLNGYTEKICVRCADVSFGDIVKALGHDFSIAPTIVEKTCTKGGEVSYTCARDGCGFIHKFILAPSHNLEEEVEYVAPTCQNAGYTVMRCSTCNETVTLTLEATNEHSTYIDYVLISESCLDGIKEFYKCRHCNYTEYISTIKGMHFEKYDSEENNPTPKETVIYLSEHLDLSGYGITNSADGPVIVISEGSCLCKKTSGSVSLRDPNCRVFDMEEVWSMWCSIGSMPYEGVQGIFTTRAMGPYTQTYNINVTVRKESLNCLSKYYVDFLLDYNSEDDTAVKTLSYYLLDAVEHRNTVQTAALEYEGGECHDGVIVTTYCNDCQTVVDTYHPSVDNREHYYMTTQVIKYLKNESSRSHDTKIIEQACPCGSRRYIVNGACNFGRNPANTIKIDDDTYMYVYKCNTCNISYALKTQKSGDDYNSLCERYNYHWVYWMCDENGENAAGQTNLYAREIIRAHTYMTDFVTYDKIGDVPCLYEHTIHRKCYYCNKAAPITDSWIWNEFKHDYDTTVEADISGTTTLIRDCKNCENLQKTVTDAKGNSLYSISAYEDKYYLTRVVTTTIGNTVLTETFDLVTGELIESERKTYINISVQGVGCEKVSQTIYSNGEITGVYSEAACERDWSNCVEMTPTCAQPSGYLYKCLNCEAAIYEIGEPNGHFYEPVYAPEPDEYGFLRILYFKCGNCNMLHEDCTYDYAHSSMQCEGDYLILEFISSDSDKIKIRYFCFDMRYDPSYELQGEKKVVLTLYGSDGQVASENTLDVAVVSVEFAMMTISVTELNAEIAKLSLDTNAKYDVNLTVNEKEIPYSVTIMSIY